MDPHHSANQYTPETFNARAATIAPLSRREKNPAAGDARRRKVAIVLGVGGAVGSVLLMKSAATAAALWLGAPALGVVAVGAVATMMAAGSVGYISNYMAKRRIVKESGAPGGMPRFSLIDLGKSMFASKPALMAGSMAALAAVVPAAGMLVLGSAVAGVSAGAQEYFSKRREAKAAGHPMEPFTLRNMFADINKSKGAKKAFLISVGLGAAISGAMMAFTGVSAPHVTPDVSPDVSGVVTDFNGVAAEPAIQTAFVAPAVDVSAPIPEVVAPVAEVATPAPVAEAAAPVEAAPVVVAEAPVTSYEIQKGDTLWEIAKQFAGDDASKSQVHSKMHEIAAFNRIENIDHIRAGDTLKLPVSAEDFEQVSKLRDEMAAAKAQAVVAHAPAPTVHVMPAPAPVPVTVDVPGDLPVARPSEVIFDTTNEKGVQTLIHSSGIIETRTPVFADAAQNVGQGAGVASVSAPAPVVVPAILPSAGECTIVDTDSALKVNCKIDANAVIQPGSGIDFRTAASSESFRVGLSSQSAPVKAIDFLESYAVPEAREAYNKGGFAPKP